MQFTSPQPIGLSLPDYGIRVKQRPVQKERELTTEQFLRLFEPQEALRMAYVPHFVTICVMYYLEAFIDYTRSNRMGEYRKANHQLRRIADDYDRALRAEMGVSLYGKFLEQRQGFFDECGCNLTLSLYTFSNALSKNYGSLANVMPLAMANLMLDLAEYIERFDRNVNRHIAKKVGNVVRNHGDARITAVKEVCRKVIGQYRLKDDKDTAMCVKVLTNKAISFISKLS